MKRFRINGSHPARRLSLLGAVCLVTAMAGGACGAEWQETLETHFDIVSTFDDLMDWRGAHGSGKSHYEDDPKDFPKKMDGSPSIWGFYSVDAEADRFRKEWIDDHGEGEVWRGTGKSMCIDYGIIGSRLLNDVRGPTRIGFKIGDSPEDGYMDEVHVFYMSKWPKSFFKTIGKKFDYHEFLKTLQISAGFKTVGVFGTDTERNWMEKNCSSPYPRVQVTGVYGMNAQIYNFFAHGNEREVVKNTLLVPRQADDKAKYCDYDGTQNWTYLGAEVGVPILAGEWFGIEHRIRTSKPHGAANGEFETWVYDGSGNVIGHELITNVVNFKDGPTYYNHAWNKFVWGGNRFDGFYCGDDGPGCSFGATEHFYLDDVVVHGGRIGPAYFSLLEDKIPTTTPETPSGLRVFF